MGTVLAPEAAARSRPLTDVEVAECRLMSDRRLSQTRLPACWALAEATLTHGGSNLVPTVRQLLLRVPLLIAFEAVHKFV